LGGEKGSFKNCEVVGVKSECRFKVSVGELRVPVRGAGSVERERIGEKEIGFVGFIACRTGW